MILYFFWLYRLKRLITNPLGKINRYLQYTFRDTVPWTKFGSIMVMKIKFNKNIPIAQCVFYIEI